MHGICRIEVPISTVFPTIQFCGISTGNNELMVDGLLANVGIGIVLLCCSSSLAKEVPVPTARGTDSLVVSQSNEFVEKGFGVTEQFDESTLFQSPQS